MDARSKTSRQRILVFFPGALGDFLCFLPALQHLGKNAVVDLLAHSEFGCLLPRHIRVRSLDCAEVARLFVHDAGHSPEVREFFACYDHVYSWLGSTQKEFVDNLMAASRGGVTVFPFRSQEISGPTANYYLSCVGNEAPTNVGPSVAIGRKAILWAGKFWQEKRLRQKRVLALGPGSGAREKNWPLDYFKTVSSWWREQLDGEVLVFLGPVEEDLSEVASDSWEGVLWVRNVALDRVAALLARSELYVGNDSGITHLAANVGTKAISIFGPSDPIQWSPRGRQVTVLSRWVECSPCMPEEMKKCPHRKCLRELSPEVTIRTIEVSLAGDSRPQAHQSDGIIGLTRTEPGALKSAF